MFQIEQFFRRSIKRKLMWVFCVYTFDRYEINMCIVCLVFGVLIIALNIMTMHHQVRLLRYQMKTTVGSCGKSNSS